MEVANQNVRALHFGNSLYPFFLLGTSISKHLIFAVGENDILLLMGDNCLHFATSVADRHPTGTGYRSLSDTYSAVYINLPTP